MSTGNSVKICSLPSLPIMILVLTACGSATPRRVERDLNTPQQSAATVASEASDSALPPGALSRGGVVPPAGPGNLVTAMQTPAAMATSSPIVTTLPPDAPTLKPTAAPTEAPDTPIRAVVGYQIHVVSEGEDLTDISARSGVPINTIMRLNGITNPDLLYIGQALRISATVTPGRAPGDNIIPDSEAVYGPAYAGFDVDTFAQRRGGYLTRYAETVEGTSMSGPQIVQLVSERFSIGPRILLTILEMQSGWVTGNPANDTQLSYPLGYIDSKWVGLYRQLWFAADKLNEGYYGEVYKTVDSLTLLDGTKLAISNHVNAGTLALQDFFAYLVGYGKWSRMVGPNGFVATYRKLFGDPFANAIEPLVPDNISQPPFRLPFQDGHTWFFVGGPHGGWADGSAWAAVDLAPLSGHGSCWPSDEWAVAVAPGRIVTSEKGRVIENLEGKDFQGSGWSVMYMHMGSDGRVAVGTLVKTADDIGHPSCEGGAAQADHLHIARLYNGQWVAASDRRWPLVMSGWQVWGGAKQYDGALTRGDENIGACNCTEPAVNGIVAGSP